MGLSRIGLRFVEDWIRKGKEKRWNTSVAEASPVRRSKVEADQKNIAKADFQARSRIFEPI